MFSKLVATGEGRHPLYSALIEAQPKATPADEDMREKLQGYGITPTPEPEVLWNFEKFLVGRNGNIVARFAPDRNSVGTGKSVSGRVTLGGRRIIKQKTSASLHSNKH